MKKIVVVAVFALCVMHLAAQGTNGGDENFNTIFNNPPSVRAAFRFISQGTRIDRDQGVMLGASAGLLFNRKLFVGAEHMSLANSYYTRDANYQPVSDEAAFWRFSYTGARVNYMFNLLNGLEVGIGTLIGGGNAERLFVCNGLSKDSPEYMNFDQRLNNPARFLVLDPNVFFGVNLTRAFKVELNTGYRVITAPHYSNAVGITSAKFAGFTGGFTVQLSIGGLKK